MELIDGIIISKDILSKLRSDIASKGVNPKLHIIYIGENESSRVYIDKKIEAGKEVGIEVSLDRFEGPSTDEIKDHIERLSRDDTCNGIIIQLPAPRVDLSILLPLIPLKKDVDGLNPNSLGLLWHNEKVLIPATARAILLVLENVCNRMGISLNDYLKSKRILIINRSILIGKPLAASLLNYDATITIAHSKTTDLKELVKVSDIVISATGSPGLLNDHEFKPGAVIIDAGFKKIGNNIYGDIDHTRIQGDISYLSPVPNGVGPIGVACLLQNTYEASL